ncbi:MAG: PG0541 family transporter-associated protein [Spirochaetota bacterium]
MNVPVTLRTEVVLNRAIEEDLMERLHHHGVASRYTVFVGVQGVGSSGERRGDHVWPEENIVVLFYLPETESALVVTAVRELKHRFPNEGIKLFQYPVTALIE